MIGMIMAGGRGTRMDADCEKLLLWYKKPSVLHVVDSLMDSGCVSEILAVTSPHSPDTKKLLQENGIRIVDTPGAGYSEDLSTALGTVDDQVLVVPGDLPLLDGQIIQEIVSRCSTKNVWTSVLVTDEFLKSVGTTLGYSVVFDDQKCRHAGISVVNAGMISSLERCLEEHVIVDDRRVAINLNTRRDYDLLGTT